MKANKSKKGMRARMARFAKTFWRKVKEVAARVSARAKKVGRKINDLGNFAPTPEESTKPSVARRAARVVLSIPRAVGALAGALARGAAQIISAVGALVSALLTGLVHVLWGIIQTIGLALATPYYLTYSPEYAKANWSGFWDEFTFKELRDLISEMLSGNLDDEWEFEAPAISVFEIDIPEPVAVASTVTEVVEVTVDTRPEAQQPKGHPTPKRSEHKIEPYPFRPAYAEAI